MLHHAPLSQGENSPVWHGGNNRTSRGWSCGVMQLAVVRVGRRSGRRVGREPGLSTCVGCGDDRVGIGVEGWARWRSGWGAQMRRDALLVVRVVRDVVRGRGRDVERVALRPVDVHHPTWGSRPGAEGSCWRPPSSAALQPPYSQRQTPQCLPDYDSASLDRAR